MIRLLPLLAIMALFLASVSVVHAQTTTPTVSTVAVTSDPGTDYTYALGNTIEVGLTFSEAVTVTGAPSLLIEVGGTNRQAATTVAAVARSSSSATPCWPVTMMTTASRWWRTA